MIDQYLRVPYRWGLAWESNPPPLVRKPEGGIFVSEKRGIGESVRRVFSSFPNREEKSSFPHLLFFLVPGPLFNSHRPLDVQGLPIALELQSPVVSTRAIADVSISRDPIEVHYDVVASDCLP